jgi:hypothetical protein
VVPGRALYRDEAGAGQLLLVEGERRRRNRHALLDGSGGHAWRSHHHQGAEDFQAERVSQSAKNLNSFVFGHLLRVYSNRFFSCCPSRAVDEPLDATALVSSNIRRARAIELGDLGVMSQILR